MKIFTDASITYNENTKEGLFSAHAVVIVDENANVVGKKSWVETEHGKNINSAEHSSIMVAVKMAKKDSVIYTDSLKTVQHPSESLSKLLLSKNIKLVWISRENNFYADLLCHKERANEIKRLNSMGYEISSDVKSSKAINPEQQVDLVNLLVKPIKSSNFTYTKGVGCPETPFSRKLTYLFKNDMETFNRIVCNTLILENPTNQTLNSQLNNADLRDMYKGYKHFCKEKKVKSLSYKNFLNVVESHKVHLELNKRTFKLFKRYIIHLAVA